MQPAQQTQPKVYPQPQPQSQPQPRPTNIKHRYNKPIPRPQPQSQPQPQPQPQPQSQPQPAQDQAQPLHPKPQVQQIQPQVQPQAPIQVHSQPQPQPQPQQTVDQTESPANEDDLDNNVNTFDGERFARKMGVVRDSRIKTEDVINSKNVSFKDFNLSLPLLKGIAAMGFENPSPIQAEAIPYVLLGNNLVARAKNGTGKTGAFVIPLLQRINTTRQEVQALVMVNTRELAYQTADTFKKLSRFMPDVKIITTVGGNNTRDDLVALLQGVHIVVCTPGRIHDLSDRRENLLKNCEMFVLDEADKLLSDEAIETTEYLLTKKLKKNCQVMLFSATYPSSVKNFIEKWMPNTEIVNMMEEITLKGVTQYYAYVEEKDKLKCLQSLFQILKINQVMIFCNNANRAQLLAKKISGDWKKPCYFIHSQMSQLDRNKVFHEFRNQRVKHLVSTDLCTRGIDIQTVNVVINFDFPYSPETYLHRIGRAGRFGHLGLAINLITPQDRIYMYQIEKQLDTEITPLPSDVDSDLYCK